MADDNEENGLTDEEYDALLRDLEGRAAKGDSSASADIDEDELGDIDEFLKSVEADDDSGATKTATDDDDGLASEFASLEEADKLPAESKKSSKPSKKKPKKAGKPGESNKGAEPAQEAPKGKGRAEESSRPRRVLLAVVKNVLWFTPAVLLWWVLGFYLGQWVSAGWLIALMSALVVLTIPYMLRRVVRRGTYRPWALGFSLVAIVALVAPMPNVAGDQMSHYGHWPASAVAELTGAPADAAGVTTAASATGWLAAQISTTGEPMPEARQLGTIFPLDMQWPPEEGLPGIDGEEIPGFEQTDEFDDQVDEPVEQQQVEDEPVDAPVPIDVEEAGEEASDEIQEALQQAGEAIE